MATIIIPTPLRKFTGNQSRVQMDGKNIESLVESLTVQYPELRKHLVDDKGQIRNFINIFLGSEDIRDLQQEKTVIHDDSVVSIVPAIAGGCSAGKKIY